MHSNRSRLAMRQRMLVRSHQGRGHWQCCTHCSSRCSTRCPQRIAARTPGIYTASSAMASASVSFENMWFFSHPLLCMQMLPQMSLPHSGSVQVPRLKKVVDLKLSVRKQRPVSPQFHCEAQQVPPPLGSQGASNMAMLPSGE